MLKALRDNLALLALLVTLVGISSTEAYYAFFGLKYQFINLSGSHIVYRGLTSVFLFPLLFVLYAVTIALIVGQSRIALLLGNRNGLRWMNYAIVVIFTVAAWYGGIRAGVAAAQSDAMIGRTTLPLLSRLSVPEGNAVEGIAAASEGYRLLLHTASGVYIIRPIKDPGVETPLVRYIASGKFHGFTLCAGC